jgi:serine/threonine-protein kinase
MHPDTGQAAAEGRVGSTLKGKYTLERLIGMGGMAAVYRSTHRNGNRVAVKVLNHTLSAQKDLRDRFLREGYVANKVDHRGAVRVLDDDEAEDGSVFLVMELLEGETVGARWEKHGNRLPVREVVEIAVQLLDVLAAAHDKGIVHRDIKPENLFLTFEGVLKVLDFGIARLIDPLGGGHASATRSGRMLGTPAYMPPEQVLGRTRSIDGQTDLWSVGASMFSLLTGEYVHVAETVEELLVYTGSRPARAIASVAPDLAPPIAAVIDRALSFEKAARWPNARAMQAALDQAYSQSFGGRIARPSPESISADEQAPTVSAPRTPAIAPTVDDPTAKPSGPPAPLVPSDGQPLAHAATIPSVTTTGGVTDPGSSGKRGGGRMVWIGLAAAALVVLGGGALALRGGGDMPRSSGVTASPPQVPPPPSQVTLLPESPVALAPVPPVPVIEAGGAPIVVPPRAPATAPRPAQPAPPAAATPNCNPPYTIDSAGRRIPRPECL